jgi:hypothetical protein
MSQNDNVIPFARYSGVHPHAPTLSLAKNNRVPLSSVLSKPKERVLLCPVSESRTEGGRRQESEGALPGRQADDVGGAGFWPSPLFVANPGTVKSFAKNSPGSQHGQKRVICLDAMDLIRESASIHNCDPAGCAARKRVLCGDAHIGGRAPSAWHRCHDGHSASGA